MRRAIILRLAFGLIVCAAACDERRPAGPSPVPSSDPSSLQAPALPSLFTLSGVVYESTPEGLRPLADAPLEVSVEYPPMPTSTTSDSQGRYRISGLTRANLKVVIQKEGYSQPCRAAVTLTSDSVLDIYVVSDARVVQTGPPASMPITQPVLIGFVFERTVSGVKPVARARVAVDFSGGFGGWEPSATTLTDAAGRYLLCGVAKAGFGGEVIAGKVGYHLVVIPLPTPVTSHLDIELVPERVAR
jgi:hypothetical protein